LLADERLGHVWLIQADSRDVGHIVVTLCYSMEYGGVIAFVDDLFVHGRFAARVLGTTALAESRILCGARCRAIHVETGKDNTAAKGRVSAGGIREYGSASFWR